MSTVNRKNVLWARIGCLASMVVVAVLIWLISIGAFIPDKYRLFRRASQRAEYKAICAKYGDVSVDTKDLYRVGKIWMVFSTDGTPANRSGDYYNPLAEIEARNPSEVGTLVCVGEVHKATAGVYESGKSAYHLSRRICLVDMATGAITYATILHGDKPPNTWTPGNQGTGSDPSHTELTDFVLGLPEK